jgi:L-ascorbate metabolism protein UlaG (beta-lactamase superfamily)
VPEASGRLGVTFAGVSTLLFDDGDSAVLFDGFFSRPSLLKVGLGRIAPDEARISAALEGLGLEGLGVADRRLDAVVPVHTHFDHALDSAEVARRTGAQLVGSESAARIGQGAGLEEKHIRIVSPSDAVTFGSWALRFAESEHCPPDRFPGTITQPLTPPAKASTYRCGTAWSVLVTHDSGRSALVQGSAGFVPGTLDGWSAEVAYLGIGMLGHQSEAYVRDYWTHTVRAVGASRVVLTHWDDFFRPLDQPLRATPYVGDDLDATVRTLEALVVDESLHFPTLWRREDPWSA